MSKGNGSLCGRRGGNWAGELSGWHHQAERWITTNGDWLGRRRGKHPLKPRSAFYLADTGKRERVRENPACSAQKGGLSSTGRRFESWFLKFYLHLWLRTPGLWRNSSLSWVELHSPPPGEAELAGRALWRACFCWSQSVYFYIMIYYCSENYGFVWNCLGLESEPQVSQMGSIQMLFYFLPKDVGRVSRALKAAPCVK